MITCPLRAAIEAALHDLYLEDHEAWKEADLERELCAKLGDCDRSKGGKRSPTLLFDPPRHPPPFDDKLRQRGYLDILWRSAQGPVCIELKLCKRDEVTDTYGYHFCLDVHRLERAGAVIDAMGQTVDPVARFSLFVSHRPAWWLPSQRATYPTVEHGKYLAGPCIVEYCQPAQLKRGATYRGFAITNTYELRWQSLTNPSASKYLLIEVRPQ